MTPRDFERFLDRDKGRCWHCGTTETLVPHHRANRGHGGSKGKRAAAANIIVMCAAFNSAMDSNSIAAAEARRYGWKLSTFAEPEAEAIFSKPEGRWYLLTNEFGRSETNIGK